VIGFEIGVGIGVAVGFEIDVVGENRKREKDSLSSFLGSTTPTKTKDV
jgi:hypothetical protein